MKKQLALLFVATSLSACAAQDIQINKAGDPHMSCAEIVNEIATMDGILDTSTKDAAGNMAKTVVNETETVGNKVSEAMAESALLRDGVRMLSTFGKSNPEDKAVLQDRAAQRKEVLLQLRTQRKCNR